MTNANLCDVAGQHSAIYEAYYNVVDPKGFGSVGGMEAARFLKRSGLSDVILSKIWDMSDPGGRGCLDKAGMFVALKLVALVQSGRDLNMKNINLDVPPPKMGDIPLPKPVKPPPPSNNTPLITSLPPTAVDWSVKPRERENYEKLFDSLQPINGLIPGNKVKNVLMESKLPFDTLEKIWILADQDNDGMLDRYEFIAAMHLVYKALDKYAIPKTLPVELMPPAKRKISGIGAVPPMLNRGSDGIKPDVPPPPLISSLSSSPIPPSVKSISPVLLPAAWVVTAEEKIKSDVLFLKSDSDQDGLVSGKEIKDVFLQSGLRQEVLAHIWALCDIKQTGKLNNEQFALAMWFVGRSLKGIDPPPSLLPEMVPPSFRTKKDSLSENNIAPTPRYSNPELEMVAKDIEELGKERLTLEKEITQKEADIRIKKSEITSLQSELDTLSATLKQLENQKGEAQKRLNDLKAQVDKLRQQAAEQASTVASQEAELSSRKEQLESLKQEEQKLQNELDSNIKTLDHLASSMQESQLNISQAKALQVILEEQNRQITDAITMCEQAINSNDVSQVPDSYLNVKAEFRDLKRSHAQILNENAPTQNGFSNSQDDPFANKIDSGFSKDPFQNDPFKSNPSDFGNSDAFSSAFSTTIQDGFDSDPFTDGPKKSDPFEAFGDSRKNSNASAVPETNKDPFGCDPFAILHAPTRGDVSPAPGDGAPPRPTSPSPALPPKKSKVPPPRPAPPRPAAPPKVKSADPFGGDAFGGSNSSSGFADFSDFETKLSSSNLSETRRTAPSSAKGLEFSEDPFRNYRYEDPFNITFDDDDENDNSLQKTNNNNNRSCLDAFNTPTNNVKNVNNNVSNKVWTNDFNNDNKFDPFGLKETKSIQGLSEDQQLAWAAKESLRLENERRQRQQQEQAELELAINLSKADK